MPGPGASFLTRPHFSGTHSRISCHCSPVPLIIRKYAGNLAISRHKFKKFLERGLVLLPRPHPRWCLRHLDPRSSALAAPRLALGAKCPHKFSARTAPDNSALETNKVNTRTAVRPPDSTTKCLTLENVSDETVILGRHLWCSCELECCNATVCFIEILDFELKATQHTYAIACKLQL